MLKRQKDLKEKEENLKIIKRNLSSQEFRAIFIKNTNSRETPELLSIIMDTSIKHYAKAKIADNGQIHIRVENVYGSVYEGFTDNYTWFLKTFSFA